VRDRRIAAQAPLGFAAGLPLYLTGGTLTAWMEDSGVSIEAIGVFALVAVPYNLKFLWAPVLDRYRVPVLGRRRGWIALFQVLLAAAIAVLGLVDVSTATLGVAAAALCVAVLSASQDVVVDAYRTDVLTPSERGRGTGMYVSGYRIALIVAGSGAFVLADVISWQATYFILSGLMLLTVVGTLWAPEATEYAPPPDLRSAVVLPLKEFFHRRGALLIIVFVMLYKVGDAVAGHRIPPFLLDIDFSKSEIGVVQKGIGMAATIVGASIGGVLIDRIGIVKSLFFFGLAQALANVGYLGLALTDAGLAGLTAAVAIDNVCNGLGTAAFVAYLMSLCHHRFSATQYALFTSAATLVGRVLGAATGFLVASYGWAVFFACTIVLAVPALALLSLVGDQGQPEAEPTHADEGILADG
jgi:PAT family beta-lactamase induction signal transducer AmpG